MPEMRFHITWPDGRAESCYSPSLIIKEYFTTGAKYPLNDFLTRSRTALMIESERDKARYGHSCSLALGQLAKIEAGAKAFLDKPEAHVTVTHFEE